MGLSAKHTVNTFRYQQLAKCAADICAKAGVTRYPLNPLRLAGCYGIKVVPYGRLCRLTGNTPEELLRISPDGFCLCKGGLPVVAYNPAVRSKGRRRWTLLHECSHVLLGHISRAQPGLESAPKADRVWMEAEAEDLTACLIAPLGVAHLCNVQSPAEMQAVFGLSRQSASYFYRDLNALRASGKIAALIFPENISLCREFISDRLVIQYRLKVGMLRPFPCLDIACDEVYSML